MDKEDKIMAFEVLDQNITQLFKMMISFLYQDIKEIMFGENCTGDN